MSDLTTLTAPFVARAAARGVRPPLRLIDRDARAWDLIRRSGQILLLDEFGELWWGRRLEHPDAIVDRPVWPEERDGLREPLAGALARVGG